MTTVQTSERENMTHEYKAKSNVGSSYAGDHNARIQTEKNNYSITSMARTRMARLPCMI